MNCELCWDDKKIRDRTTMQFMDCPACTQPTVKNHSHNKLMSLQDIVFAVHCMGGLHLEDEIRNKPMWVHVDDTCDECKTKLG